VGCWQNGKEKRVRFFMNLEIWRKRKVQKGGNHKITAKGGSTGLLGGGRWGEKKDIQRERGSSEGRT